MKSAADGWRPRASGKSRRDASLAPAPSWRVEHAVDFVIENPAHPAGLWYQPSVRQLYDPLADQPFDEACRTRLGSTDEHLFRDRAADTPCTRVTTSYCKYGAEYRKHTTLLTSLSNLRLHRPCNWNTPCAFLVGAKHPAQVQGSAAALKNSVPRALIHALVAEFLCKQRAQGRAQFLLVDVFSGWGSVCAACTEPALRAAGLLRNGERFYTHANDIAQRRSGAAVRTDLDMQRFDLEALMRFAIVANGLVHAEQRAELGVLLHCSIPCTTYSTAAGGTHRLKGGLAAKSELAAAHDALAARTVASLVKLCRLRRTGLC